MPEYGGYVEYPYGAAAGGTHRVEIHVSSEPWPSPVWTSLGIFEFYQACGCSAETSQFVDIEAMDVRLVSFAPRSTWNGRARSWTGLSEAAFVAAE